MSSQLAAQPPVVHELSQSVVDRYAELSGDFNPLHVDPKYARTTPFGRTIAHGPVGLQVFFDALRSWLGAESAPPGLRVTAVFVGAVSTDAQLSCHLTGGSIEGDVALLEAECRADGGEVAVAVSARVPVPPGSAARAALVED